jgi:hypothetical protein
MKLMTRIAFAALLTTGFSLSAQAIRVINFIVLS